MSYIDDLENWPMPKEHFTVYDEEGPAHKLNISLNNRTIPSNEFINLFMTIHPEGVTVVDTQAEVVETSWIAVPKESRKRDNVFQEE